MSILSINISLLHSNVSILTPTRPHELFTSQCSVHHRLLRTQLPSPSDENTAFVVLEVSSTTDIDGNRN
ncbi:hypothetical protein V6N13_015542 [Hibiscus sabdariffa]